MIAASTPIADVVALALGVAVIVGLYLLPTLIAFQRERPHKAGVLVINVFFGWTFLGWVISLAMACWSRPSPSVVPQGAAPSGWYPDPTSGSHRWWNGCEWGPPT